MKYEKLFLVETIEGYMGMVLYKRTTVALIPRGRRRARAARLRRACVG